MNSVPKEKCTAPCKTCPFLKANHGRPNPPGWVPDKENGGQDWYSPENVERIWSQGVREGEFLICHSTDPNSVNYGNNARPKAGNERVCLGALAMMQKTVNRIEQAGWNWTKYKKGLKFPVNKRGMMNFIGNVNFNTSGAICLAPLVDETTGVPWDDAVLNSETDCI